jgi:hypothetical protein
MPARSLVHRILRFVLCLDLVAFAPLAAAQTSTSEAEAGAHFKRGVECLRLGDLDAAITEFELAQSISPRTAVLFNLGQAYSLAGQPVRAVETLRRYLDEGGKGLDPQRRSQAEATLRVNERRVGSLKIDVTPETATVSVDGRTLMSEERLLSLPAGVHGVLATLAGYEHHSASVTLRGGETVTLSLKLEPSPGWLSVDCTTPAVAVHVDGVSLGTTPLSAPLKLSSGSRTIRLARPGYRDQSAHVAIGPGVLSELGCRLAPDPNLPPSQSARLHVVATEPESEVQIDGLTNFGSRVPLGRHDVRVSRSGFETWTTAVKLDAPTDYVLRAELMPTPAYLQTYRTRAKDTRSVGIAVSTIGATLGAVAGFLYLVNSDRMSDWQSDRNDLSRALQMGPLTLAHLERADRLDQRLTDIQRWDDIAVFTAIAGGALLSTGIAVLLLGPDPERYDESARKKAKNQGSEARYSR